MLELSNVQPEHTGFFAVKVHFADGTTMVSKPVTVLVSTTAGPHGYFFCYLGFSLAHWWWRMRACVIV